MAKMDTQHIQPVEEEEEEEREAEELLLEAIEEEAQSGEVVGDDLFLKVRKKVLLDLGALRRKTILTPEEGRSTMAEEYRVIKRPLLLNARGQGPRPVANANTIMVTSALPQEGKTFTAINLAMSLSTEVDNTVLLVDGDVAKPSVSRILGFRARYGLIDFLLGNQSRLEDVLLRTNIPKLMLLPSGRRHHHSTELLASESMRMLVHDLAYNNPDRLVVFDSPPLLMTTEARELARNMGQIVMVVESERTPHGAVKEALAQFENLEIVGLVLNKVRHRHREGYYSSYGYSGYGYGYGGYGPGGYGYGSDREYGKGEGEGEDGSGGYGYKSGYGKKYGYGYGYGYSGKNRKKKPLWRRLLGL